MAFKELDKRPVNEVEKSILEKWKKEDILKLTTDKRKGEKEFVFYDGPIYANAKPGIHHVFGKAIKDSFTKYRIMKGYHVRRTIGLDTHGLPIEVNVENGYLNIHAKIEKENNEKDKDKDKFVRRERFYGECSRSFYIGEDVLEDSIKAKFTDGILTIDIPKKQIEDKKTSKCIEIE